MNPIPSSTEVYRSMRETYDYSDPLHLQLLLDVEPYTPSRRQYLYQHSLKRFFDVFLALLGLLVLWPLFLWIHLKIQKDSEGPSFFRQERVGYGGKVFRIYKFRTMYTTAPSAVSTSDLRHSAKHITPVGAFLRKTSLDELPQLLNVLRGEMSLVGPRPLLRQERDMDILRRMYGVYHLRPGITGLAQVKGRDMMEVSEKIRLDRSYLERCSFLMDLKILCKTVAVVLKKEGVAF